MPDSDLPQKAGATERDDERETELGIYQAELEAQNAELADKQAMLELAQARYFRHFDLAPVGFVRMDKVGIIIEVNLMTSTLLGMERASLQTGKRPISAFLDRDSLNVFQTHLTATAHSEAMTQCQIKLRSGAHIRVQSVPSRNDHGETEILSSFSDITESVRQQSAIAEWEKLLRDMTEHIPGAVFKLVKTGAASWKFLFVSQGIRAIFDFPKMEDASFESLLECSDPSSANDLVSRLTQSETSFEPFSSECRITSWCGVSRWALIQAHPRRVDRDKVVWNGLIVDITERKKTETDLKTARENALTAERAKSDFLAMMSHEIRTPMNGIIGYTDLLLSTPLAQEQLEFVRYIHESGDVLLKVVNQILDFSKLESGAITLDLRPFDPVELIERVADSFRSKAEAKNLELHAETDKGMPAMLVGDDARIYQMLANLLSNSLKFTHRGSIIIRAGYQGGAKLGKFTISITDSGIGIPEDQIPKLFQPFYQVDSSVTRSYGGSGLGLAVVKRLSDAMLGTVSISSKAGGGTTVSCAIPLPSTEHQRSFTMDEITAWTEDSRISQQHPLSVLIIEDTPTNLALLKSYLQLMGYAPSVATDGHQALEALKTDRPDLALVDIQMPGISGLDIAKKFRDFEAGRPGKRTQLVAITAHVLKNDRQACISAGMDDFLSKPLRLPQLKTAIVEAWERLNGAPPAQQ